MSPEREGRSPKHALAGRRIAMSPLPDAGARNIGLAPIHAFAPFSTEPRLGAIPTLESVVKFPSFLTYAGGRLCLARRIGSPVVPAGAGPDEQKHHDGSRSHKITIHTKNAQTIIPQISMDSTHQTSSNAGQKVLARNQELRPLE